MNPLLGFFNLGPQEMLVLLLLGVFLFGRKLPEVGRSVGKAVKEFQNGLKGMEADIAETTYRSPETAGLEPPRLPPRITAQAPQAVEKASAIPFSPEA